MRVQPQQTKWSIGQFVIEFMEGARFEGLPRYALDKLEGNCLVNIGWFTSYERAFEALEERENHANNER